jgi:hypothetical protein
MSTKCNIIIRDNRLAIQLYRHSDGYPGGKYGVVNDLRKVARFAWPLPRFEADDYAAAIVRAMKKPGGGSVYIDGEAGGGMSNIHGDCQYVYLIESPDIADIRPQLRVYSVCDEDSLTLLWRGRVGNKYPKDEA